jgi:hypothetical protein
VASLPKNSYCSTKQWVKSCGCFSAGSSAQGVVQSLSDPWWRKGWWRVSQERALGIVGTTVFSLCSLLPQLTLPGVPVVISVLYNFLFSLFFSQKSPPIRRARTPDKHGAIEGAEISWSSELFRAGVGLPNPNPRGQRSQSAWFVGVCEEKFIRHGASLIKQVVPISAFGLPLRCYRVYRN